MTRDEMMEQEIRDAEEKAWDALGRYKFWMFGYWAAIWVHLNRCSPILGGRSNPFYDLVQVARKKKIKKRLSDLAIPPATPTEDKAS